MLPPLFRYFQRFNIMELKTEKDRLEPGDLLKLQAYGWLYMAKHSIYSIAEVTLSAVVHHLSAAVFSVLPALGYKLIEPGIFRRETDMISYLIATEDLPDEVTPEELQIFSNPARRQKIILSQLLLNRSTPILEAVFDLYQSEVFKMINVRPEFIDRMIETLGHEKLLAHFRKEDILASLSKEDLMANLSKEEILRQLLAELGPEQLHKLIDKLGQN